MKNHKPRPLVNDSMISLRMPIDFVRTLHTAARAQGTSLSDLCRTILEKFVAPKPTK